MGKFCQEKKFFYFSINISGRKKKKNQALPRETETQFQRGVLFPGDNEMKTGRRWKMMMTQTCDTRKKLENGKRREVIFTLR